MASILLLLVSLASAAGGSTSSGRYSTEVVGETVILRSEGSAPNAPCILGSADDRVLERLRRVKYGQVVTLDYERLPRPVFPNIDPEAVMHDRRASVRGQIVAPWCDSDALYWIRSFADRRDDWDDGDGA